VLLPADILAGRAYAVDVIGPALAAFARGAGRRTIAAEFGVPTSTVADWTRRLTANADAITLDAIRRVVALDQDLLSTTVHARPAAAALDALGRLATAITARWPAAGLDPWRLLALATGARRSRLPENGPQSPEFRDPATARRCERHHDDPRPSIGEKCPSPPSSPSTTPSSSSIVAPDNRVRARADHPVRPNGGRRLPTESPIRSQRHTQAHPEDQPLERDRWALTSGMPCPVPGRRYA
jgi:hypothetical protein